MSDLGFILYMIRRNLKQREIRNKCHPCPDSDMSLDPMKVGEEGRLLGGTL